MDAIRLRKCLGLRDDDELPRFVGGLLLTEEGRSITAVTYSKEMYHGQVCAVSHAPVSSYVRIMAPKRSTEMIRLYRFTGKRYSAFYKYRGGFPHPIIDILDEEWGAVSRAAGSRAILRAIIAHYCTTKYVAFPRASGYLSKRGRKIGNDCVPTTTSFNFWNWFQKTSEKTNENERFFANLLGLE